MEFKRRQLKKNAKAALKGRFLKTVLATFIVILIAGAFAGATTRVNVNNIPALNPSSEAVGEITEGDLPSDTEGALVNADSTAGQLNAVTSIFGGNDSTAVQTTTSAVPVTTSPLTGIYALLVGNVMAVGLAYFFIRNRQGETELGNIFQGFKKHYGTNVGTMLLVGLFTFLWGLLLVIPGIIKGYAYSMIPYVLADNPDIGWKKAFNMSKKMTRGYKWKLFVLDLSFIGWYLLGALCCGIGTLFVTPYYEATKAEAYELLKANQISEGNPDFAA